MKYTCSHAVYYSRPCEVAFSGFSVQDLETVILYRYKANTNFSEVIAIDTLHIVNPFVKGDTLYGVNDPLKGVLGFWGITEGVDYQIHILNLNKSYSITGIATGPESVSWQQDTPCALGASQASIETVNNIHINNQLVNPIFSPYGGYNYFIYLQR